MKQKQTPAKHSSPLQALHEPSVWLAVLWAVALGWIAAGWDVGERAIRASVAENVMLLLPAGNPDEAAREAWRKQFQAAPGVARARWLAPADVMARLEGRFDAATWPELLPGEETWMPWMLEVTPADPIAGARAMDSLAAARRREPEWRTVLWEAAPAAMARERLARLRAAAGVAGALLLVLGAIALRLTPRGQAGAFAVAGWSGALAAAATLAPGMALVAAIGGLDERAPLLGAGVAIVLAGAVAPMIRRGPAPSRKALNLTLREEPHERPNPSPGQ